MRRRKPMRKPKHCPQFFRANEAIDAANIPAHTRRMDKKSEPQVWQIFVRLPSNSENPEDYAAECYKYGVIAVGWSEVGDLNQIDSRETLKRELKKTQRQWVRGKPRRVASWAGSLWSFKESVKKGHFVLCPDKQAGRVYVGRVLSKHVSYNKHPMGNCDFVHRRKVQWFRPLNSDEVHSIWKDGRIGGIQTVSEVRKGLGRLRRFLRHPTIQKLRKIGKMSWHPDKEWGDLAEKRAMAWLRGKGRRPKNVANLRCGWDIECDGEKFEVKGRKSEQTIIRLTENEWKAAKKFGKGFTVLLFTAPTPKKLNEAEPWKIPDAARTEKWNEKVFVTREYFLDER